MKMAASVNKVIIVGNLGKDPEVRYTPAGRACCSMSVATSYQPRSQDGTTREARTDWHKVTAWGKTAELCKQYLSKGRSVYVEGHLKHDKVEGKDGNSRYFTEVVGERVVFLGGGRGGGSSTGSGASGGSEDGEPAEEVSPPPPEVPPGRKRLGDDLPF
jgi:single-strand DNA-binding protein